MKSVIFVLKEVDAEWVLDSQNIKIFLETCPCDCRPVRIGRKFYNKVMYDVAPAEPKAIEAWLDSAPGDLEVLGCWDASTGLLSGLSYGVAGALQGTADYPFKATRFIQFMSNDEDGKRPLKAEIGHHWSGWTKRRF